MSNRKKTQNPGASDVLQGEIVYLRPPVIEELPFIRALWADPETMAPVGGPHPLPQDKAPAWFARMVDPGDGTNCYCLIFNQENVPVGEVSFHQWNPQERSAVLNIKILAAHRRRGYGKDALRTFLAWFFGSIGGCRISDHVAPENRGGQQLLLSAGFDRDPGVPEVCMMVMTRHRYTSEYGEPG